MRCLEESKNYKMIFIYTNIPKLLESSFKNIFYRPLPPYTIWKVKLDYLLTSCSWDFIAIILLWAMLSITAPSVYAARTKLNSTLSLKEFGWYRDNIVFVSCRVASSHGKPPTLESPNCVCRVRLALCTFLMLKHYGL